MTQTLRLGNDQKKREGTFAKLWFQLQDNTTLLSCDITDGHGTYE